MFPRPKAPWGKDELITTTKYKENIEIRLPTQVFGG